MAPRGQAPARVKVDAADCEKMAESFFLARARTHTHLKHTYCVLQWKSRSQRSGTQLVQENHDGELIVIKVKLHGKRVLYRVTMVANYTITAPASLLWSCI